MAKKYIQTHSHYVNSDLSKNNIISSVQYNFTEEKYYETKNFLEILYKKILNIKSHISYISITEYKKNSDIDTNEAKNKLSKIAMNLFLISKVVRCHSSFPQYSINIKYKSNNILRTSGGTSSTSHMEAMLKAFGEYLERYNSYLEYSEESKKLKTFPKIFKLKNLKDNLDLNKWPRPLKNQSVYDYFAKVYDSSLSINSIKMYDEVNNKYTLMPVQCGYYMDNNGQSNFLFQTTTNGAGGGTNLKMAKLSGIYELIERDHFLLYWLSGISPDMIDIDTLPEIMKDKFKYIENRYKFKFYILDTSHDVGVFSTVAVMIDMLKDRICMAAAAGSDVSRAINKATEECLSVLNGERKNGILVDIEYEKKYIPFSDKHIDRDTRMQWYNTAYGVKRFSEIFLQGKIIPFQEVNEIYNIKYENHPDEFKDLVEKFKKLSKEKGSGYNLYTHEHTGPLLDYFNYHTIKSFVPAFHMLWLNENLATPFSPRLVAFAKLKGKLDFTEKDINILPHPFP